MEEGVLLIFITLQNTSPSAGFTPANLGSHGKHANHQTTEDSYIPLIQNWHARICIIAKFTY
jgi:hypothetical protein